MTITTPGLSPPSAWRALLLIGCIVLGSWAPQRVSALSVPELEARYDVYGFGVPIGEMALRFAPQGENGYRIETDGRTTGLAALFLRKAVRETAEGTWSDGAVRPLRFERIITDDGKPEEEIHLEFDRTEDAVRARTLEASAELPLDPSLLDPLSIHLAVKADLAQGRRPAEYILMDKTRPRTYRVSYGQDVVETPLGRFETVLITQRSTDSDRVTRFWYAPALDHMPVQIAQTKDGRERLRLVISHLVNREN